MEQQVTAVDVAIAVNGSTIEARFEPNLLLATWLREGLGLTGTHIGCDSSQCGACTVHVDGHSLKTRTMLAAKADGAAAMTIEGLAQGDRLHPMQQAFQDNHGLQCGFRTPGMVMSAIELSRLNPRASQAAVRDSLAGNFCRCTGFRNIAVSMPAHAAAMQQR